MYWLNLKSLKQDLRTGQFKDINAVPYIIAAGIMMIFNIFFAGGYSSPIDLLAFALAITAVVWGTWHVFKKHNENSESSFLMQYISLSWVVSLRCLLAFLPLIIILTIPIAILCNDIWINITGIVWSIIVQFVFYYLLGKHISET